MSVSELIRNISIIAHVDHGKTFRYGTSIRLADGGKKLVENLTMDDCVLGLDGLPKKIVEIHTGEGQLYNICQKIGCDYAVNGHHQLVLKFTDAPNIYWDSTYKYYKVTYIQNMKLHDKYFAHMFGEDVTEKSRNMLFLQANEFLEKKKKEYGYNCTGDIIEISVIEYLKLPANIKKILYGFKHDIETLEQSVTEINVVPIEVGKYAGFQIEGDGRFLGIDDTVMHNSTTADALVARAGLISEKDAGEKRWTDGRQDEQERGITIKSTGVSMQYELDDKIYKVNLVDSPGHIDFSHEVSAALRITDGAIVVIDAVEGVAVQTETVLRQALAEQVKPILYINKIDRCIFELKLTSEEIYQRLLKMIESVNNIMETYKSEDSALKLDLSPDLGNIYFGSAYHGWGFGLKQMAKISFPKIDEAKMMKLLWGERYFDEDTKKVVTSSMSASGKILKRTFCKFVLDPILDLITAIFNDEIESYRAMFVKYNIKMTDAEIRPNEKRDEHARKAIYKLAMKRFLPLADALIDGIVYKLPSPKEAQTYRVTTLYDGPLDDENAISIKNCDENGPLMIYISKMIPMEDSGRFFAFGRVFSGTAHAGQKVRIMGCNYKFGTQEDYYENKNIQRVARMIGGKAETAEAITCGNTIALVGVDQYILKSGTIATAPSAHPIKTMKFSVSPIVQVAVSAKSASDLQKLTEGLKKLSKSDPSVQCFLSESGDHIVAGVGELHIEICLNDLRDFMKTDINVSQPIVPLRETIMDKSSQVCLSKSPNKHNRIYVTAEPLDSKLVLDMANKVITMRDDVNKRYKFLADNYNWDPTDAKKIWCFGPEGDDTNLVVDTTKAVQYLNEIRDSVQSGFKNTMQKGILCEEPVRGVRININDVMLHADAVHRGGGQIIPTTKRAIIASMLTAQPAIMEPVYMVEIQVPQSYVGAIYSCLQNKRGEIFSQEPSVGELVVMRGYLPVHQSFGFSSYIREHTSGQASAQLVFDHWQIVPGNPMDKSTLAGKMVAEARKRKGLSDEIPDLADFLDKL